MLSIVSNCTRIGCPSQDGWTQFGQTFENIGDKSRVFLVEPFKLGKNCSDYRMKPLCSNQQVWHFFKKWMDGGLDELIWINDIGKRVLKEKYKEYFHIDKYGNKLQDIIMQGYNKPGFKYRVEYNGSNGLWSCTCKHFHLLGKNFCCKHINACIGVATNTSRLQWPLQNTKFIFDDTYSEEHIGLRDIVVEITPDAAEDNSDMDLSSDGEFGMVPVFKHWL